jgi:hypothetical protein
MYLTAHHVVSPSSGLEGINAFHYAHGPYTWERTPPPGIPDQNPGELVARNVVIAPPGNRVRSYLDLVAPDETGWAEIRPAFMGFVGHSQRNPFPWTGQIGRCFFRLGMDFALAQQWQREIADLYRAIQFVRVGG